MSNRKKCSCGAWMEMVPTGKFRDDGRQVLMPLNEELVDGVSPNVNVVDGLASVVKAGEAADRQPHHATCPNTERWHERARQAELIRESRVNRGEPKAKKPKAKPGLERLDTALPGL